MDRREGPQMSRSPAANGALRRTVALIGLMGAGKSAVGRRLATTLKAPFFDSDDEIVRAATMPIPDIFEKFGERHFREGERRVIARLLSGPPHILATGGGAFITAETRALLRARAHVVWLRADLDTLVARCGRRDDRPLLKGRDVRQRLAELMEARDPVYAQAESVVESVNGPHEVVVRAVMRALQAAGDIVTSPKPEQGGT